MVVVRSQTGALLVWIICMHSISSLHMNSFFINSISKKSASSLQMLSSLLEPAAATARNTIQSANTVPAINENILPRYMTEPLLPRNEIGRKLSIVNRKYSDMGLKLRSKYTKLKLLTQDEEVTAGKFSAVGKKLEKTKISLERKLGRESTLEEWAAASKLSVREVELYSDLANRARNRLVQHNIRLVDHWTRRIIQNSKAAKQVSYYELVTEGIVGLTKAAENYDGRSRFAKYAEPYIRHELYKGMTSLRPGSFVSHKVMMMYYRSIRAQIQLRANLNREPTDEEIAAHLKTTVNTVRAAREQSKKHVISADTQLGSDSDAGSSNTVTYLDLFLTADQEDTSKLDKLFWQLDVQQALDCLSPTERRTLNIRYGLLDGKPRNVETTAELMCVSAEGIRKTIIRAMEKIRNSPSARVLKEGPPDSSITTTSGRIGAISY